MRIVTSFVVRAISFCTQYAAPVIILSVLLGVVSSWYAVTHFAMTTDVNQLISPNLAWRQREAEMEKAFPHFELIVAVVNAPTTELVEGATNALAQRLSQQKDLFRSIEQPKGGRFFAQEGLLFEATADLTSQMNMLSQAQRLVQVLAGDPSLRGVIQTLQFGLLGVQGGQITLDNMAWPMTLAADTIEKANAGKQADFSWYELVQGHARASGDLVRFLEIRATLDYSELEPGKRATDAIRKAAADLDLRGKYQAQLRLTGPVPMADEEFSTIKENAALNATVTIAIVLLILWLALRWMRIIFAVFVCVAVGLSITAAVGMMLVGTLNLISVYFAVLFVGLGVDFGIQFSVRYRAERHSTDDLHEALLRTGRRAGAPLTLAALATAAGFLSFLPTVYKGVSELGLIAGIGMLIAFATSITLLPALLSVLKPPGETEQLGYAVLAPVDSFLERHRMAILIVTAVVVAAGLPLLYWLRFDFNPINLRSPNTEAVSTYLSLKDDPASGFNDIQVLEPSLGGGRSAGDETARLARGRARDDVVEFYPRRSAAEAAADPERGEGAPAFAQSRRAQPAADRRTKCRA